MYLCYVDESGTPDVPGNTSHFVLAGISIPIWHWRNADREISEVLARFGLVGKELHTAWILRRYLEQSRIMNFENLSWAERRRKVLQYRNAHLLALQQQQRHRSYRQARKNYKQTAAYVHLTDSERRRVVDEIADIVADWGFARLFAECIDKVHFDPDRSKVSISEQAFEQIVSRFEKYLQNTESGAQVRNFGLLVHDNNETVARRHTEMMRTFHEKGTLWTNVERIIETPLFVDSRLTTMVQIADLCSYALRRYVENEESALFRTITARADRIGGTMVGVRHFTDMRCTCEICRAHRR